MNESKNEVDQAIGSARGTSRTTLARRGLGAAALLVMLVGLSQCTVTPEPVYASNAQIDVYSQQPVYYEGRPNYWSNGQWYYSTPRGWATYRRAPPELERRRPYVQQAPPAYRSEPAYRPQPTYRPQPAYRPQPTYRPTYQPQPAYRPNSQPNRSEPPRAAPLPEHP